MPAQATVPQPLAQAVNKWVGAPGNLALQVLGGIGLIPRDFQGPYADYLTQIGAESQLSEIQKKSIDKQVELAKMFNIKYRGMDPNQAARNAAKGLSLSRIAAGQLMSQYGIDDALGIMYQTMQNSGVMAPVVNAPGREHLIAHNNKLRNLFSIPINNALDFQKNRGMDPRDYSLLFASMYQSGEFNKFLNDPTMFDARGNISNLGRQKIDKHLNSYHNTAKALKKLPFMKGKPSIAVLNEASQLMGADPVKLFGENAGTVVNDIVDTAKGYGLSGKDTLGTLEQMASIAKRNPRINSTQLPVMAKAYIQSAGGLRSLSGNKNLGSFLQDKIEDKLAEYNEEGVLSHAKAGMAALVKFGGYDENTARGMVKSIITNPNAVNAREKIVWLNGTVNTHVGRPVMTKNVIPQLAKLGQKYKVVSTPDLLQDIRKDVKYETISKKLNQYTKGLSPEQYIKSISDPVEQMAAKTKLDDWYKREGKQFDLGGGEFKNLLTVLSPNANQLGKARTSAMKKLTKATEGLEMPTGPNVQGVMQDILDPNKPANYLNLAKRFLGLDMPGKLQEARKNTLIPSVQDFNITKPRGMFTNRLPSLEEYKKAIKV
jgi:hypothetical protein